jgi:CubicO group peptidase (beta-lactamase class C family)
MGDTMFLPPQELSLSIAPTMGTAKELLTGIVQDENARMLGGVAGHAGLFSSASDLSRFAAMILNNGKIHGIRLFKERVLSQMTAPYFYSNGNVIRGLGWDIHSPYSSPRGSNFSEMSFGHTGYSGSSIWIDPESDLFVILLTVRLNYRDTRHINRLRSDISTIAASVFSAHHTTADVLLNM